MFIFFEIEFLEFYSTAIKECGFFFFFTFLICWAVSFKTSFEQTIEASVRINTYI